MFSPGRIILVLGIVAFVYFGWFAVPSGPRLEGEFDPDRLAECEVNVWKALAAKEEFGVYVAVTQMTREEHRYSWFRAAQSGFSLGRATNTFEGLKGRYERVLPDLEDAARIDKEWMGASFDPAAVARAQLNWWVTRRLPNLNTAEEVGRLMAEEYALRYAIPEGAVREATLLRAQAVLLRDAGGIDPDWPQITKILADSYRSLHGAIQQQRTAASMKRAS
jgi:hypothetical protein